MRVVIDGWAWIDLSTAPSDIVPKLKKQLTINRRKVGSHPGEAPGPIHLFSEKERPGYFGIPREFFLSNQQQKHDIEYRVSDGLPWPGDVAFTKTLYDEQQRAADAILKVFRASPTGAGIAQCPTSWGKTILAGYLFAELRRVGIVLVNKDFLLSQWVDRMTSTLEGVRVGVIQGNTWQIEGCHIVVAMMQTLVSRGTASIQDAFGFMVVDECHHVPADTYGPLVPAVHARHKLGLSATPRRKDGSLPVLYHTLGPVIFHGKVLRLKPKIRRVYTHFRHKGTGGPMHKILMLKDMTADNNRNHLIVGQIHEAVKVGRKVLCLSERVQHLADLARIFRSAWDASWGKTPHAYHLTQEESGDRTPAQRDAIMGSSAVTFATFQLVSEAFDYPPFDTLVLATPCWDVEQSAGRILRPFEGKKDPIIVDIRDDEVASCRIAAKERDKFYASIGA